MAIKKKLIEFDEDMLIEMIAYASIRRSSTVTSWIKSTLQTALDNATPTDRAKLDKILGV